jgi:hypothetical protein
MAGDDVATYLRGQLRLKGVTADTPLDEVLDAVMALEVEGVPGEQIGKWRKATDRAVWRIRPPDRDSWGESPEQQAKMARLAKGGAAPGVNS